MESRECENRVEDTGLSSPFFLLNIFLLAVYRDEPNVVCSSRNSGECNFFQSIKTAAEKVFFQRRPTWKMGFRREVRRHKSPAVVTVICQ